MLPSRLARVGVSLKPLVCHNARRNFGVTAVLSQKAALDPIQQLYILKSKEYEQKKKAAGGRLVDADPKVQAELEKNLNKIHQLFGADKVDLLKPPVFKFSAEHVEDIFADEPKASAEDSQFTYEIEEEDDVYDENVPYYNRYKTVFAL